VPLVCDDPQQTNPYNCFIYCDDGNIIKEIIECYGEIMLKYGPKRADFEGCDEATTMYWFDKKNGNKGIRDIVRAFEPTSVITIKRSSFKGRTRIVPFASKRCKNYSEIYFHHG
jgi:hypothetical protein